jgi:hypothetical protein
MGMPRELGVAKIADMLGVGQEVARRIRQYIEGREEIRKSDLVACMVPWGLWADALKEGTCTQSFLSWLEGLDLGVVAQRIREEMEVDRVISEEWREVIRESARWMAEDWEEVEKEVKRKAHMQALVVGQAKMWGVLARRASFNPEEAEGWGKLISAERLLLGVKLALERWFAWRTWGILSRRVVERDGKRRRVWGYGLYDGVIWELG